MDISPAQSSRWLTRPEVLQERGRGTIIISLPGNVVKAGIRSLAIFNRNCRMMKARPDLRTSQDHTCQSFEHHQETYTNSSQCGVCTDNQHTSEHKCTTRSCPGGPKMHPHTYQVGKLPLRSQRPPQGHGQVLPSPDQNSPHQRTPIPEKTSAVA